MNMKKTISLALAGVITASAALGCGNRINQDAVVATLKTGDETIEISLGLANFMAQYQAVTYDSYYLGWIGEELWATDLFGSGSTLTDDVKEDVMDGIYEYKLLELHMEDYDVTITDEEMDAINKTAKQFIEDNDKKAINALGAKEEYLAELLRFSLIQEKMNNAMNTEVDTNVTDEEAAQRTYSYVKVSSAGYTDEEGNYVEYTDDEKAALKEELEKFAETVTEDFAADAEAAGYTVDEESYGTDNEDMDEGLKTAIDALKEGETAGPIEADDNYYVIRLKSEFDEEATQEKKESIIEDRKDEHYTEVLDGYKEDVEWTIDEEVWAAVNFDELYTIKETDSTESVGETETE